MLLRGLAISGTDLLLAQLIGVELNVSSPPRHKPPVSAKQTAHWPLSTFPVSVDFQSLTPFSLVYLSKYSPIVSTSSSHDETAKIF